MTASRKKSASPDIAVRNRLLSAAIELFSRKGYPATTTREIVAAAEVTNRSLYYYFQNKEGIYLELMRGAFDKFDALLDASPRGERECDREVAMPLRSGIFPFYGEYRGCKVNVLHLLWTPSRSAVF